MKAINRLTYLEITVTAEVLYNASDYLHCPYMPKSKTDHDILRPGKQQSLQHAKVDSR